MVAVIDYDCGNLRSVSNALARLRCEHRITRDESTVRSASHIILPGVGAASSTMKSLKNTGLDKLLPQLSQPVLGICIGMQLMCRFSEEGNVQCLGIFEANVQRLVVPDGFKVPHMGWNTVVQCSSPLTEGIADGAYFYFVHSYAPTPEKHSAALTYYGNPFSSILQNANFFGTQFHPEKSGAAGERLLANFIKL